MTLEKLQEEFPSATLETWHQTADGGWIENTAVVSGNARVFGDAQVYGNAQVSGDARMFGDARVFGDAWDKSPLQIQGTRHFCCMSSARILSIGCKQQTISEWVEQFAGIGAAERYSAEEIAEYKLYIDLFAARYGVTKRSGEAADVAKG